MASNKIPDGVGKKIVEALKKQSEIEINAIPTEETQADLDTFNEENLDSLIVESNDDFDVLDDLTSATETENLEINEVPEESIPEFNYSQPAPTFTDYQKPSPIMDNFGSELDNFEIPSNVAVLKKLVTQLPSGVTRHTGAQIIRQTMEALGISMKSVLQEAQQVQDGLNNASKECHATIQDYKKQILSLEKQAQNHQKQSLALNELISLFIQTGR